MTMSLVMGGAVAGAAGAAPKGADLPASVPQLPGAADVGFSQDMATHHSQAILMTQIVIAGKGSTEVRALATTMQVNQLVELGMMQGWLAIWAAPVPGAAAPMSWMASTPSSHMFLMSAMAGANDKPMVGMASQDELNHLATLSGTALDVFFLQLMIRHHDGGMAMSTFASSHAALPAVRALAARMVLDEKLEVVLMTRFLKRKGGELLGSNF